MTQPSDWSQVSDPKERKRIQNRLAQRTYRDKRKTRMERLEALFDSQSNPSSSSISLHPSPTCTISSDANSNSSRSRIGTTPSTQAADMQEVAAPISGSQLALAEDGHSVSNSITMPSPMSEDASFLVNDYEEWSDYTGSKAVIGLPWSVGSSIDVCRGEDMAAVSEIASVSPSNHSKSGSLAGKTSLHLAAEHGRVACVRLFLDRNTDIAMRDEDGYTALHLGIARGHLEVVREICTSIIQRSSIRRESELRSEQPQPTTNPADILNVPDRAGNTPLHTAVSTNQQRMLLLLLQFGQGFLDLELQNLQGWTALHMAAAMGHAEMIKILLDNSADAAARVGQIKT